MTVQTKSKKKRVSREIVPATIRVGIGASEASLIEDAALTLRDKVLIRVLRRLACRIGEALGLEEKHIDFARRQVRIEHEKVRITLFCPHCQKEGTKTRLGKKHTFCPTCGDPVKEAIKKATSEPNLRTIPIDQDTLDLIKIYIKKGGITVVGGKRFLFDISRQWAYHIVRDCAERAGFKELINPKTDRRHHVSPHKFRASFATEALKRKPTMDDARLLQELLGHADINTTMGYRKVEGQELHDFYDSVISTEDE
jgi:integrase/recombinase XerD